MLRAAYTKLMAPILGTRMGVINQARASKELDDLLLFEEVVGLTHLAAAQVVAVTSAVNALGGARSPRAPSEIKSLLPSQHAIVADLARCAAHLSLDRSVIRVAAVFAEELNGAHAQIKLFCDDVGHLGMQQACFFHLLPLRAVLRKLSRHALRNVEALAPDVRRCLSTRYALNTETLSKLLASVIDGQAPCVGPEGQISVPELPQRRPSFRRDVRLSCIVEHEGKTSRAVVKDISTGGVGLEKTAALSAGRVVVLELTGQRCLSGVVVWAKGAKAGIKFDVPLKPADPLLAN